jgi:hypothetical protein
MKDDPLNQSTIADQVREEMAKRTLWLNADNFAEMCQARYEGYCMQHGDEYGGHKPDIALWRMMCAAALAVVEWRMGGRVRP